LYEFISGKIVDIKEEYIVLENNGIGYRIFTSKNCISNLEVGATEVTMYMYLSVREDALVLYGFNSSEELNMFELLLKVSKIGSKIAISILSVLTSNDIKVAILNNDVKALCTAPGVGKKTANRMILELKDRIDDNIIIGEEPVSVKTDNYHDALYGLISLGYTRNEATRVLSKLEINNMAAEDIIRVALNKLSKK